VITTPSGTKPLFSVITICFNDFENLKRTSASVLDQSNTDYEWIVVDGGSSDGTANWLTQQTYPQLQWVSEKDRGLYHAMNKGMDKASGQYLVFMNSGDCFADSEVLTKVAECIHSANPLPLLIYGDSHDVTLEGGSHFRRARSHTTLMLGMFAQHQAMFFHATDIRFDEKYRLSADYGFIGRVIARQKSESDVLYLDFSVCRFLLGGLNESRRFTALKEDWSIRRTVLGASKVKASFLLVAHYTHTLLKKYSPSLGSVLRRF
jgi:putative colanic acid biosynthesis glycosyltransferase